MISQMALVLTRALERLGEVMAKRRRRDKRRKKHKGVDKGIYLTPEQAEVAAALGVSEEEYVDDDEFEDSIVEDETTGKYYYAVGKELIPLDPAIVAELDPNDDTTSFDQWKRSQMQDKHYIIYHKETGIVEAKPFNSQVTATPVSHHQVKTGGGGGQQGYWYSSGVAGGNSYLKCKAIHRGDKLVAALSRGIKLYAGENSGGVADDLNRWDMVIDLANVTGLGYSQQFVSVLCAKSEEEKRAFLALNTQRKRVTSTVLKFDWWDMRIPPVGLQFWKDLTKLIPDNSDVLVCCQGGHGRTGTALCALIIVDGMNYYQAIEHVRDVHCEEAVETVGQENYLKDLSKDLHGTIGVSSLPVKGVVSGPLATTTTTTTATPTTTVGESGKPKEGVVAGGLHECSKCGKSAMTYYVLRDTKKLCSDCAKKADGLVCGRCKREDVKLDWCVNNVWMCTACRNITHAEKLANEARIVKEQGEADRKAWGDMDKFSGYAG